ncbi:MAG: hypothetical protein ACREAE_00160 [Nitrosopumilaceae archaeon]
MEPIDAILEALTEAMSSNKLYNKSFQLRPGLSKTSYTKVIRKLESDQIINIKKINGRENLISLKGFDEKRAYNLIKKGYEHVVPAFENFLAILKQLVESDEETKIGFLSDPKYRSLSLHFIDYFMALQKYILFQLKTAHLLMEKTVLENYNYKIDEYLVEAFRLIGEIQPRYLSELKFLLGTRIYKELDRKAQNMILTLIPKLPGTNKKSSK